MYSSQPPRKLTLTIHHGDKEIPLVIYGASEQAIVENIRELTNLYRFRCLNKKQQPLVLSSNLPDKTHIYVVDPTAEKEEESDEPTAEEQVDYLKSKVREIIDAKTVLNAFKSMLIKLEQPPPAATDAETAAADAANAENTEKSDSKEQDAKAEDAPAEAKQEPAPTDTPAADATTSEAKSGDEEKKDGDDAKADSAADAQPIPEPDPYAYSGKYAELITEIESKLEDFQTIIMDVYALSDDLIPPKPVDDAADAAIAPPDPAAVDAPAPEEPELSAEQKEEALLSRLVSKMQPTMQQQVMSMQQLFQMQMSMMAMLSAGISGGGAGGGAGGVINVATPALGGVGSPMMNPMFGGAAPQGQGQAAQALPQSETVEAKETVEEEKEPDRTAEFKEWFGGSDLVDDDEYAPFMGFFGDDAKSIKSFELLYRASKDGYDATSFHEKCDDKGATLTVILSEHGHVFGGFTKASWKDESRRAARSVGTWREDKDAFIFLLRSNKDDVLPGSWKLKEGKHERAVKADRKYGPTFGYGYDIRICDRCNDKKDSSSQCDNNDACFTVPPDDGFLPGEFYFLVKDYEVYAVKM